MRRLGVISDTHGLLRLEAIQALTGVDHILHLGDIGTEAILASLRQIAPITAVRGNNDKGQWARTLQARQELEIEGKRLYLLHDLSELDFDPAKKGYAAVISGHSHKASLQHRDGVLFLNPGSAGPRRFKLPVSLAFLNVAATGVDANLQTLKVDHQRSKEPNAPRSIAKARSL